MPAGLVWDHLKLHRCRPARPCPDQVAHRHEGHPPQVQATWVVAAWVAVEVVAVSTAVQTGGLFLAHRYFVTFPSNFLIATFTGPLTSALSQNPYTDFDQLSSVSFGTMLA